MALTHDSSRKKSVVSFLSICSIFVAANLIASSLSHIDDTDETYGYYEPLHYLLHGIGMQTWEYSPSHAIRTYAFLTPFWLLGSAIKLLDSSKVNMFYGIRTALGIFTALSESYFLVAIYEYYGKNIGDLTLVFTLFSSGILYCSTALLPSAVIMSLVMIATASWMRGRYLSTILIGCISVLWSGWPFIGIIYVPFGLQMLCHTFFNSRIESNKKNDNSKAGGILEGFIRMFTLIFQGAVILVVVGGSAAAVDFFMYNRRYHKMFIFIEFTASNLFLNRIHIIMISMCDFFAFYKFKMQNVPYMEHSFVQCHRRQW